MKKLLVSLVMLGGVVNASVPKAVADAALKVTSKSAALEKIRSSVGAAISSLDKVSFDEKVPKEHEKLRASHVNQVNDPLYKITMKYVADRAVHAIMTSEIIPSEQKEALVDVVGYEMSQGYLPLIDYSLVNEYGDYVGHRKIFRIFSKESESTVGDLPGINTCNIPDEDISYSMIVCGADGIRITHVKKGHGLFFTS